MAGMLVVDNAFGIRCTNRHKSAQNVHRYSQCNIQIANTSHFIYVKLIVPQYLYGNTQIL